ncbi:MAG: dihydrofolate reductase [Pseudomonadota bacterium]
MTPRIGLIVAMAKNRVIGRDGDLPWRLKTDLRHFRRVTWGKPVVMGRKTFQSIGRVLPGRQNIVVGSTALEFASEALQVADFEAGLQEAALAARPLAADEVLVIGGASLYAQALPRAHRIYLTLVDAEPDGDTFMPEWDEAEWRQVTCHAHEPGPDDDYPFSFILLERIGPAAPQALAQEAG